MNILGVLLNKKLNNLQCLESNTIPMKLTNQYVEIQNTEYWKSIELEARKVRSCRISETDGGVSLFLYTVRTKGDRSTLLCMGQLLFLLSFCLFGFCHMF